MCDKCTELNNKIAHYSRLSMMVLDENALDGIRFLVAKYCDDKKALHPESSNE
jgi:hypothetical protein